MPKKSPRASPAPTSHRGGRAARASRRPPTPPRSGGLQRCSAEDAHRPVEDRVVVDAKLGIGLEHLAARVERPDRDRVGRRRRRGHRPNPGPGRPSFPTGATTSVPSGRAGRSARLRARGEGRVRLDAADERNRRGVLDIAVAVGVDCTLEPGEQEIAAAEHGPAPSAVCCQPITLIGRTRAPGATPCNPDGPS